MFLIDLPNNIISYAKRLPAAMLVVFSLISTSSIAQNISMMTWNTGLLDTPDVFGINVLGRPQCEGSSCRRRATAIAAKITAEDPDVVLLQEVWVTVAINEIKSRLSSAGYTITYDQDAGLMTASKFGIAYRYFEEFREAHGTFGDGGDVHVDKGFLVTTIGTPSGQNIIAINTHMDSGTDCEDRYTRMHQLYQFRDYLNRQSANTPIIYGGDFNVSVNRVGKIGICNHNEYYQVVNEYGFNPADRTTKTEFQLLKQILGMEAVHEILNTSLSRTTVSSQNSVLDFFMTIHHSGDVTFQNIRTLDQIYGYLDTFCYILEEIEYGRVTRTYKDCFPYELSDAEIYDIVRDGDTTIRMTDEHILRATADHNPVLLNMSIR